MDLLTLQFQIHQQNKDKGWYDNPRDFHRETALYNTEIAEAIEGIRKGMIKDDHLPQYPMHVVEVADLIIRQMCYLGKLGNDRYPTEGNVTEYVYLDVPEINLNKIAAMVMSIWQEYLHCPEDHENYTEWAERVCEEQRQVARYAIGLIQYWGYDPMEIIQEKLHYNTHRPDHTTECRAAEGGKKW